MMATPELPRALGGARTLPLRCVGNPLVEKGWDVADTREAKGRREEVTEFRPDSGVVTREALVGCEAVAGGTAEASGFRTLSRLVFSSVSSPPPPPPPPRLPLPRERCLVDRSCSGVCAWYRRLEVGGVRKEW